MLHRLAGVVSLFYQRSWRGKIILNKKHFRRSVRVFFMYIDFNVELLKLPELSEAVLELRSA